MTRNDLIRHIAFVMRCSLAASLSYALASAIALPHPVWASMSAIIVSQEKINETKDAMIGRFGGTLIGIVTAMAVSLATDPFGASITVQLAIAVAICAVIARFFPILRVCMWTTPIVFLTAHGNPPVPIWTAGIDRATEVVVGGIVGALLHALAEQIINRIAPQHTL
jgi:uncharacterized membrane protein YgaE (UPF0421/DUF939 family)